ncbi:MAG TPA: hypothetical protein PKI83_02785, partial [Bacteroidales bacterium]|nr:hypothetical protein [Bacteroidales bacterium]
MKSFFRIIFFIFILLNFNLSAQNYDKIKLSKIEAYEDLSNLYQYLTQSHPNINEVSDSTYLKNAFSNIFLSIDDSISIDEFFIRLVTIFSKIDDSHLMLNLDYYAYQRVLPKFFGGVVAFDNGKIYLLKDIAIDSFFVNTRILSINDIDATEIYNTLSGLCNADIGLKSTKDNNASLLFYYYFPIVYQVKNFNSCILLNEMSNDTFKYSIDGISMRDQESSQSFFSPYLKDL